jgi:Bacterial pre-peptidase C-terminal domain
MNASLADAQSAMVPNRALDLVLRNPTTGLNFFAPLNSVAPGQSEFLESVLPSWQIVGTADLNRDGETDLLWRDTATGQNTWWLMQNNRVFQAIGLRAVPDATWQIVSVADANRDTGVDILWRNSLTGQNLWWLMQADQFVGVWDIMPITDTRWTVVGTGDWNRDGNPDILWRNASTGENLWWWMNGATCINATSLPGRGGAENQIVGIDDFNGDGYLDILWQNRVADTIQLWTTDGEKRLAEYNIAANLAGQWEIVGLLSRTRSVFAEVGNTLAEAEVQTFPNFFRNQSIQASDRSDVYRMTVGESGYLSAWLTGLSGDADVRLIQDSNSNGVVDVGEAIAWQWERGTRQEVIRRFVRPGTYFLEVFSTSGQTANYTLSSQFSAAAFDAEQFRLTINYGAGTELLNEAAKAAIASAAAYWENAIPRRSAITNFQDLTIFLTVENLNNVGILAQAGPNLINQNQTLVIATGSSLINSQRVNEFNNNPDRLRLVMTHEFAHVLGFGTIWRPFTFSGGITVGNTYVNFSNQTYNANTYAGIAYGELLGSNIPTAISVDSAYFHWDENLFDPELLTPFVEASGAMPISQMTIASLRDLGWEVNYGAAQFYQLGNRAALSEESTPVNAIANVQDNTTENTATTESKHGWTCGCAHHLTQNRANGLSWIGQSSLF